MRALNLQTCGSLAVIVAFMASEAGADLLSAYPNSRFAWYLNLEVFHAFECARLEISPLRHFFGPTSLSMGLLVFVVALALRAARDRFGVALVANLSFLFTILLANTWLENKPKIAAVSLTRIPLMDHSGLMLVSLMLCASFLAFAVSHGSFIVEVMSQRRDGARLDARAARSYKNWMDTASFRFVADAQVRWGIGFPEVDRRGT